MKTILSVLGFLAISTLLSAQAGYETTKDPNNANAKILVGTINKSLIAKDSSFKWYDANQQAYQADTAVVSTFKKVKDAKLHLVIFGGTWCEDTQAILPKFFKLQELSELPETNITLFGVNRSKVTLGHIAEAFGITNVPTFIVMKDGKEIGRVIEYGKTGKWDKELAAIINTQ